METHVVISGTMKFAIPPVAILFPDSDVRHPRVRAVNLKLSIVSVMFLFRSMLLFRRVE